VQDPRSYFTHTLLLRMEGQGEQQQQQQQQQQEQLQQLRQQIVDGERTISMLREQFQQETDTDVRRALQQQVTAKEQRVTALQQEVTALQQEVSALVQLVTAKELHLLAKGTRLHPFPSSMHHLHSSLSMLEQTCMSSDYLANNQAPQLGHDCRRRGATLHVVGT